MTTTAQLLWANQEKKRARDSRFEGLRDILRGYLIEVNGSIEGSRAGLVWFKSLEADTPPMEVFNPGEIQNVRAGMYCEIERFPKEPARWQIIGFQTGIYFDDQGTYEILPGSSGVGPHAREHEWRPGRPGSDPVTVYPRAISDFAVRSTSPASMKVRIYGGWYPGASNYERFSGPINSKDFTSDVPGTSGLALIAAITVDATGTVGYTNGTTFVNGLPVPSAAYPSVPTDVMIISAIRLVNGMTEITEANFDVEIRPLLGPAGLGGGGGGLWTDKGGGGGIYYTGANVGVGDFSSISIDYNLHLWKNAGNTTLGVDTNDGMGFSGIYLENGAGGGEFMTLKTRGVTYPGTYFGLTAASLMSLTSTSGHLLVGPTSTKNLYFGTNSTVKMTILSGGNVGIGVSPSYKLDVSTNIRSQTIILIPAVLPSPVTGQVAVDSADSNALKWYNGTAWESARKLLIDKGGGGGVYYNGKVGVGDFSSSTIDAELHVKSGSIRVGASTDYGAIVKSAGTLQLAITRATGVALIDNDPVPSDGSSNSAFRFFRNVSTTGTKIIQIFRGDGTGTADHNIYGGGGYVGGAATGGNKGVGTINIAGDIYKNNSAYTNPDYVLEHYFTGKVEQFKNNSGATEYSGLVPLDKLRDHLRESLRLPGRNNEPIGIFDRADLVQRWSEELYLYVLQLHERIELLETR